MINELLFVYGSLLNKDNEFANYLDNNAVLYSTGELTGRLYDVGEYPGAVTSVNGGYNISGNIYKLNNVQEALKILDDYEGYGPDQDQPNLFIRDLSQVEMLIGTVSCWAYFYNLPVSGLTEITSGNYLDYVKQK